MSERFRSGVWHDPAALDRLVREHLPWIEGEVRRRLGAVVREDGDTRDVVQEALLEVLVHGPSFATADRARFQRLLLRIVENNIRDRYRKLHRMKRDRRRVAGGATDSVLELDPPLHSVATPSACVELEERREWVFLAVELLAPEDRDAIRLRDWEELEFDAVGERLGISGEAARKRYHRALPRLAEKVIELRRGVV
ncbi:MAG: sigma-70 family RNA polymerase sigma factor [Planctomycetes bacterium]|nr:sigma-70 family RNA polymerase sigma factor [Planctomycetota bacterium]